MTRVARAVAIGTLSALCAAATPSPAAAQQALAGVQAEQVWLHDPWPLPGAVWQGTLLGATGDAQLSWLHVSVSYVAGELHDAPSPPWSIVDGEALAGIRPVPWLGIAFGPHARSYDTPGGRYRRLSWEARLHVELPLTGGTRGFLDLTRAVATQLSVGTAPAAPYGGAAGVLLRVPWLPAVVRFAYGFEDGQLGVPGQREATERLSLGLLVGAGRDLIDTP